MSDQSVASSLTSSFLCDLCLFNAYHLAGEMRRSPRRSSKSRSRHNDKSTQRNRVLLIGRIRELALYRAEVLRNVGFQVLAPDGKQEVLAAIRRGDFDVAVLSYTLSSDS